MRVIRDKYKTLVGKPVGIRLLVRPGYMVAEIILRWILKK
jgi:hypothetical protein